jgi:hypothetical protein
MASDNKLELVIEVEADKANAQIKGVNQRLAGVEGVAVSVAKNASEGIGGMTASMVKGSLAGDLLAEAIKGAAELVKEYVAGAVEIAAHTERPPRLRISDCGFEAVQPGPSDARPEGENRSKASGILNPAWSAPLWNPHPERNRRNQGFS